MSATTFTPPINPARSTRASDFATMRSVFGAYIRNRSPQLMLTTLAAVLAARLLIGGWGIADLIAVGVVILINGTFEWVVHRFLLHAPEGSIRMRVFGTSVGHGKHHVDPADMNYLMLRPVEVVQFVPMLATIAAVLSLPLLWITGSPMMAPYLTALVAVYVGLAHYEWTHLLVHARYRPTSRYYARLSRNHRLHHHRNENYWLGVTSNSGDRLLRTLPKSKTDVPLSDTGERLIAPSGRPQYRKTPCRPPSSSFEAQAAQNATGDPTLGVERNRWERTGPNRPAGSHR